MYAVAVRYFYIFRPRSSVFDNLHHGDGTYIPKKPEGPGDFRRLSGLVPFLDGLADVYGQLSDRPGLCLLL